MHLQIITPEHVIFDGDVDAVSVPGKSGEFQLLDNHAPIVSTLSKGSVKIKIHSKTFEDFDNITGKVYQSPANEFLYLFDVNGGILEMNNNQVMILAN